MQSLDLLVNGNGSTKLVLSKGTKYINIFNPNPYNISLYRDSSDLTNRIGYVASYSNQSIPLPHLGVTEFPLLISWVGTGASKILIYFTEESLGINQSFSGAGASDNVTIVGDSIGLARSIQLPGQLTANGNLKVAVLETAGLKPSDLNRDASKNIGVFLQGTSTVNIGNTPHVVVDSQPEADFTDLINAIYDLFKPKTIRDTSTAAALDVVLDTGEVGGRSNVEIYVESTAAADFKIYGSTDGLIFREVDTISLESSGHKHIGYSNAYRYIKVETNAENNNVIEIVSSR